MANIDAKNFLAKEIFKRVALNYKSLNIKSKVPNWVLRLTKISSRLSILGLVVLSLMGYYPTFAIPPIKQRVALAQESQQTGEVIAVAFPNPITLPHPGYLSTRYSPYHPGVDIATGLGMPVRAINPGIVEDVVFGFWGYGNHVFVSHQGGYKSMYAHMGRVYVKPGQEVTSETTLGEVGMTGWTSGPHTHLEITKEGKYIDPLTLLPELPNYPTEEVQKLASEIESKKTEQVKDPNYSKSLQPDFN